jgi:hypothetical protein
MEDVDGVNAQAAPIVIDRIASFIFVIVGVFRVLA